MALWCACLAACVTRSQNAVITKTEQPTVTVNSAMPEAPPPSAVENRAEVLLKSDTLRAPDAVALFEQLVAKPIEPTNSNDPSSMLGKGYDTASGQLLEMQCVERTPPFESHPKEVVAQDFSYDLIVSSSQLVDEMRVSLGVSYSFLFGHVSAFASLNDSRSQSNDSQHAYILAKKIIGPVALTNARLARAAAERVGRGGAAAADVEDFFAKCGDRYVSSYARAAFLFAQFDFANDAETVKSIREAKLSGSTGAGKAELNVFMSKLQSAVSQSLKVKVAGSGYPIKTKGQVDVAQLGTMLDDFNAADPSETGTYVPTLTDYVAVEGISPSWKREMNNRQEFVHDLLTELDHTSQCMHTWWQCGTNPQMSAVDLTYIKKRIRDLETAKKGINDAISACSAHGKCSLADVQLPDLATCPLLPAKATVRAMSVPRIEGDQSLAVATCPEQKPYQVGCEDWHAVGSIVHHLPVQGYADYSKEESCNLYDSACRIAAILKPVQESSPAGCTIKVKVPPPVKVGGVVDSYYLKDLGVTARCSASP